MGNTTSCHLRVCNYTRDQQIGLPLRGCPFLIITRMITDLV